jgi:hypothetical protein
MLWRGFVKGKRAGVTRPVERLSGQTKDDWRQLAGHFAAPASAVLAASFPLDEETPRAYDSHDIFLSFGFDPDARCQPRLRVESF